MRHQLSRSILAILSLIVGYLAAMAPVLLVLGAHYPLIALSASFQKLFWSPAVWQNILDFYEAYLVRILICCELPAGVLAVFSTTSDNRLTKQPGLTLHDWVTLRRVYNRLGCRLLRHIDYGSHLEFSACA